MRAFSLLFAAIALVMLAMLLIYVIRGPMDPLIAAGLLASLLACLLLALFLLRPFEPSEELKRRREELLAWLAKVDAIYERQRQLVTPEETTTAGMEE